METTLLRRLITVFARLNGGGGDASPIVGTGKVGSMRVGQETGGHTVTVSLTSPQDSAHFALCEIFAMDSPNYEDTEHVGLKIGEITQASGNVTMEDCPHYFAVFPQGTPPSVVMVPSSGCSGSGGVAYITPPSGSSWDFAIFEATGDGTAILSGVDYDF